MTLLLKTETSISEYYDNFKYEYHNPSYLLYN